MTSGHDITSGFATSRIGLIVLAAGSSSRFGAEDKLGVTLHGTPLAHHLLGTLDSFDWGKRVLVCRAVSHWTEPYRAAGFGITENDNMQGGMLSSLHAGLSETKDLPRTMICLADMPFVTSELLRNLIETASVRDADAVACRSEKYRGPPAIFRTALLNGLPTEGEGGARALLSKAEFIDCPADMLRDIDTVDDWAMANKERPEGSRQIFGMPPASKT